MATQKEKAGTINMPIARKKNSIIERQVSLLGQNAITHYKVLKEFDTYSLIECNIETGRTHQIRVHFAHIGTSILGDTLYGNKKTSLINRQALHSYKINFIHPVTKKKICLTAPIPKDISTLI